MIRDLDDTIQALLEGGAAPDSELKRAKISFDLPDARWRGGLDVPLTVNCYLYDVRENREMRTHEPIVVRSADRPRAARVSPPVRIDCAYCITAWSYANAVLEEHRLLSQVLLTLLRNPTIPRSALKGSLAQQLPPYPLVIASQDGVKNQPEFWTALDQRLKPSLNYVVTLAMLLDDVPAEADMPHVVEKVTVGTDKVLPFEGEGG